MTKTETAIRWMEQLAADNSHGYSQANRWGPDFDCSSAVIQAWENAGVPVKSKGATYTGNMYSVFMSCGFVDITSQINLNSGAGLIRGDVLLNHVNHTAMVTGNGRIVHARSSEGNTQGGDQSGNEIREQSYWNYPWNVVLRYPIAAEIVEDTLEKTSERKDYSYLHICYGDGLNAPEERVKALQHLLRLHGAFIDADGEFGRMTENAVIKFRKERDIGDSGETDEFFWKELIKFEV